MDPWRLIVSGPADGFTNMAVDEAILATVAGGDASPTLRLYAWSPPAISTGYFQRVVEEIDLEACQRDGVHVVRRLTGGRAVLHADEVTYSIAIPEALLPGLGVLAAYRELSRGLVVGLALLGVAACLCPRSGAAPRRSNPDCFASAAQCDLVADGRKICGSAQVRRQGMVLQQGSLLLTTPNAARYWRTPGVTTQATDLTRLLGRRPGWGEVVDALARGFAEALGTPLEPAGLLERECLLARELRRRKYATVAWNLHRRSNC